jgi:cytochrome P450
VTDELWPDIDRTFDIDDPRFNEHFYEVQDSLLQKCPVAHSQVGTGYSIINRYHDIRAAAQDWETFSSAKGFLPNRPDDMAYLYPEESDPPYQSTWRAALHPFFTPGAVKAYEDSTRAEANDLIDRFIETPNFDFVGEFAAWLPGRVFFKHLIGVPVKDLPTVLKDMDTGMYGPLNERGPAFERAFAYLGGHLAKYRDGGAQGLLETIAAGVDRDGHLCPWEDRVCILTDITLGGLATMTYVLAGAALHLANHPQDRDYLRTNPDKIANAVEEFVRFYPPVVALGRTVTKDVEFAGHQFRKDDFVLLNFAASARDPRALENPNVVDIERKGAAHFSFGVGVHRCLGSHLARMEVRVALEEFLRRVPNFSVQPDTKQEYETSVLRAMRSLRLVNDTVTGGGASQ